jgi:hypothetical protein
VDEALFCFDKAIELNPNIAAAWQGKGKALQRMGRDAEARSCFAKVESLGGVTGDIPLDVGTPINVVPPSPGYGYPESPDALTSMPPEPSGTMRPAARPMPIEPGPISPLRDPSAIMRPATRPSPIEPGPVTPEPPPVPTDPMIPGPIGIIETSDYPPDADLDTDLPPDPAAAVANLPDEADVPSPSARPVAPMPVPPDVAAIAVAGDPSATDLPPEVAEALNYLPSEPEIPDPNAPMTAPITVPPEVNEILAGHSSIPATPEVVATATPADPMATFMGDAAGISMRPAATPPATSRRSPRPDSAATVDQPTDDGDYDPALAGLPPELLEALQGIPADSPDSFNLPPS